MKRKIQTALSFALLVVIIAVSGCIGGVTDGGGSYPGVQFTALYPVATEIHESGVLTIYSSVQNNGYTDAIDVDLLLYNCGDFTGIDFICNDAIDLTNKLEKPDRELGIVGEVEEYEFRLKAPSNFPEGKSPHTFTSRITYNYESTATRDVVLSMFENWREKGGNLDTGPLNFYSEPAPISVEINAPETPVIINEGETQKFTVAVSIRNTGGGYTDNKELTEIKLCYDKDFVQVLDPDDFADPEEEEEEPEEVKYNCCESGSGLVWDSDCETYEPDERRPPIECEDAGLGTCEELCESKGYGSGELSGTPHWSGAYCKCSEKFVTPVEPGCIYVSDTNKLNLIGLQNQWRDVSVQFETLEALEDIEFLQDIIGFDATVKYTYSIDQNTQVTLVG